jgi:hypothetical protein
MDLVTLLVLGALGAATPAGHAAYLDRFGHAIPPHVAMGGGTDGWQGPPDTPSAVDFWQPLIARAAQRFGIPESWIRTVMRAESGGELVSDGHPVTSRAGAMGLMQVMPDTYAEMRRHYGLGADPYDPHDNILAGAAYLREMYDRFGYPGLFAAYNAGPDQFDGYLRYGTPLPDETWLYLAAISPALTGVIASEGLSTHISPAALVCCPIIALGGRTLFFALGASGAGASTSDRVPGSRIQNAGSGRRTVPSGILLVPLGTADTTPRYTRESR